MQAVDQTTVPQITALVAALTATRGRLRLSAFLAGAASILAMAPFFLWAVLWLTLPALLWIAATQAARADPINRFAPWQRSAIGRAAEAGWWFGFGYHVFGLFWIGEAFLVEAEVFAWLLPIAVTGLPAGLALFTAVAVAFVAWVAPAKSDQTLMGWPQVVALALSLGVTEWLRGHILTGLPWNVLGYALTSDRNLALASIFGIYGLTVMAVVLFCAPAVLAATGRRRAAAVAIVAIAVALPLLAFAARYSAPGGYAVDTGCTIEPHCSQPLVRIVQPSVPQREKWRPENQRQIFDDHLALTAAPPQQQQPMPTLVVWPEAAMPFLPLQEPVALAEIGRALGAGVTLATGALRADPPTAPGDRRRVYNSLVLFGAGSPSAAVKATYDKTHLVPFGEYLPLQRWLEAIGLQQLSRMRGGFAAGPEPRPLLDIPGIGKVAPLICYETIFPTRVIQSRERPRAMLVVTNDGWFGNTTGPRQHFHMARVRAVEEGIPVIRAANNGISAVIDAYGSVTARLDLNVRGIIDARLPPAVSPPLYARIGDAIFWCLIAAFGIVICLNKRES